jgi:two-component system chemotaxis sensor kinase CheA
MIQDYLYREFDSMVVEEFLMLFDAIEDNIDLVIERFYVDYKDAVNDLFRMIHNVKSATAYLKIKRIENFAHFVENILEVAREKDSPTEELIDWLFKVSEQFHKWYEEIDSNLELSPVNPEILKTIPKL